jgi:rhamnosyl/mannosyltransferase
MANIVHFGKYYSPESGDIETATKCFARGAVLAVHIVTVMCLSKNNDKNDGAIDGVHIIRA